MNLSNATAKIPPLTIEDVFIALYNLRYTGTVTLHLKDGKPKIVSYSHKGEQRALNV